MNQSAKTVEFFSKMLDNEIQQKKLTAERKASLVTAMDGIYEQVMSQYCSMEIDIDTVSVFDTVELREGAKVVRVSRVGKTLNMDMACAKIVRKNPSEIEVQLCFANANVFNCQPDVASTVIKKLQESLDNELRGLEWGGAAEVAKLTGGLK